MTTQLGPATNGFMVYDVLAGNGDRYGRLILTGASPTGTNLDPFRAAWSWSGARTTFPQFFQLVLVSDPGAQATADAWKFREHAFPVVPDAANPAGFEAHVVWRTYGGDPVGHFFNRVHNGIREQFWTSLPDQLDDKRRIRAREHLFFSRLTSLPPLGSELAVTTLS